jgi:type IV secretory pathway VirB3-like protein
VNIRIIEQTQMNTVNMIMICSKFVFIWVMRPVYALVCITLHMLIINLSSSVIRAILS